MSQRVITDPNEQATPAAKTRALTPSADGALRLRAEERLKDQTPVARTPPPEDETLRSLHELRLHQVELEMQNEELRDSRAETEAALARYTDLFDFAPVGYLTLDRDGLITQTNLTGARLLGLQRGRLVNRSVAQFTEESCRPVIRAFLAQTFAGAGAASQTCEVALTRAEGEPLWVRLEALRAPDGKTCHVVFLDITARKQAEASQLDNEKKYHALFEAERDAVLLVDRDTCDILEVNASACQVYGYTRAEMLRLKKFDLSAERDESIQATREHPALIPLRYHRKRNGDVFPVEITTGILSLEGKALVLEAVRDITDRALAEHEQKATIEFLQLVQVAMGKADLIHQSLAFFQRQSGCDAVGLRLRDGEDYPYYETCGFPPGFVQAENTLCQRDLAGQLVRDCAGNAVIECMCGNVLCGRFDPSKPFFTAHGSFWSNCTTDLLASTTEADRQARTRNRCNGEGYESVALLPLRVGGESLGLLQLNSRSKGLFAPQSIALWERLSGYLAVSLSNAQAHEALAVSEGTYRSLFENMLNGFAYCRMLYRDGKPVDFVYLNVNTAFETHTGLKNVVGKRVTAVIPGILEADPTWLDAYSRVASTGLPEVFERYVNALKRWFHISAYSPKKDHFVSVFDDVTERKRAEEALREREAQLRTLGDNIPGGALYQLLSSPDGRNRYTYLSAGVQRIFGYSAESVMADPAAFWRHIVAADRPLIDAAQQKSAREMTLFDCEFRQRTHTGEIRWLHCRALPRRLGDNSIIWDGVVADITSRKAAEAEREHLLTAIDQSSEIIVITDASGAIQYANPAFERVTGYTRREALGQNPRVLKSGRQDAAFYRELWQTIGGGKTWTGRFINRRKEGTLYTEEATISPVHDTAGHIVNYVAVKRDITEHIRLETQLQQAQKMESVGRLAGGVAHDFNNMLGVILGCAELAKEEVAPDHPVLADLQEIRKAAERSADLTRQLLTFARKQAVTPKVLDLNDTVAMMLKMLRRLIGENIELVWLPGAGAMTVKMDPSQIDQILANLAVNARDAIAGVGKLAIETGSTTLGQAVCADQASAVPGTYVTLTVSDSGCGMDAVTVEHIFEPFFTTKGFGEGTGLGLSTVYGIVQQNGGLISVASEPGVGSTFKIHLPRHLAPCPALQAEAPAAPLSRNRETILLVEDEQAVLKLGKRMLESLGYRVETADSPLKALEWAGKSSVAIHLLLTDVIMPEMNGWDLAKRMRLIYPNLKILFMSGYTHNVIAQREMLSCGSHFLQKPFSKQDIAAKVAEVLGS